MKVEITLEDITKGVKNSGRLCPVGRALGRINPKLECGYKTAYLVRDFPSTSKPVFHLPFGVSQWIIAFDEGAALEPFSFEIDDDKLIEEGVISEESSVRV